MNTASTPAWRALLLLAGAAWLLAHLGFWLLPNVLEAWNAQTLDQVFRWRDRLPRLRPLYDDTIVHVNLDNDSLHALQTFAIERGQYAQVVRTLAGLGVAAQAYDFIFTPNTQLTADDQALIDATRAAGHVTFGLALTLRREARSPRQQPTRPDDQQYVERTAWPLTVHGDPQALYVGVDPANTFTDLAQAARGLGFLSSTADSDGVLRRVPLVVRYQGAFYPSLPFRVICDYLRVAPSQIEVTPGRYIRLRQAQRPGATAPHDIVIPIDQHGAMLVNYIGAWERFTHYPMARILAAAKDRVDRDILRESLSGKIVLVSDVSTGATDVRPIPLDTDFPLSGLQSNVMHTILTEQFLRELSAPEMLLLEALLAAVLLLLARRATSVHFAGGALLLALGYAGGVVLGFLYGQVLANLVRPLLMLGAATVAIVVYRYVREEKGRLEGLRQRDFIRATFGRYLSPDVVEELLESPQGLQMGGETREITLLVSDLRGFTALAARLSPAEVVAILNRYFERMVGVIAHYRGTVDELQGDGLLTFFGAPFARPDDPARAVACAIAMQLAMREFNAEQRQMQLPELAMGIGLNTGEVIVGNIGSVQRTKYGAVGSAINTAYRIESHTVGGQVLLSPSTYAAVQDLVQVRSTMPAQFKGLAQPVTLYDIGGIAGDYHVSLPEEARLPLQALPTPLPIACFLLDGKMVSDLPVPGSLLRLAGTQSAEATIAGPVSVYSNIKLTLTPAEGSACPDVYAKVVANETPDGPTAQVRLEFTSLPDAAKVLLTILAPQPVPHMP